jgi:hypothetical protein
MTAEEKWDKLRAHYVGVHRHMVPGDQWDAGYKAALDELLAFIHRFDQES